jgi:hypothetical protein
MLACVNGLFAVYTLWHYRDDPAGAAPCSTLQDSGGSGPELQLANDYSSFYGLVVVNLLTMGLGVAWYKYIARNWVKSDISGAPYRTLASINSTARAKEVDYPIVKARLEAAKGLLEKAEGATPFVFDLMTFEEDSGQQLEQITLDMVLETEALADPNKVRLLGINPAEQSGLMVLDLFETRKVGGVTSWKTCWLCANKYGFERSWKACWCSKERVMPMPRVDIAASEFSAAAGAELLEALKDRWWYGQCTVAIWMAIASKNAGCELENAPAGLKNDHDFMLEAVKQYGYALQYASEELRNDREIVLAAVK